MLVRHKRDERGEHTGECRFAGVEMDVYRTVGDAGEGNGSNLQEGSVFVQRASIDYYGN